MKYVYYTYNKKDPCKSYIGMSKHPKETYKGSGTNLLKDIKKYGWDSFERIDLGYFNDIDEAHYWEGFYINLYQTSTINGGYNINIKGGAKRNEDTDNKISKSLKGRIRSKKHRDNISKRWYSDRRIKMLKSGILSWKIKEGMKDVKIIIDENERIKRRHRMIENNPMKNPEYARKSISARKGISLSEESRNKISNALKGREVSTDQKKKLSDSTKKAHSIKVSCKYCGKMATRNTINRWHNEKCKYRLER